MIVISTCFIFVLWLNSKTHLHNQIRVAHSTVDSKIGQSLATVLLHRLKNGLGLEASCFKRRASNMAALGIGSNAKNGATGVVNPVRSKQATECRDECAATIVLNRLGQSAHLGGRVHKAEVVNQELDTGASDCYAALESIHSFARAKVKGNRGHEAVR